MFEIKKDEKIEKLIAITKSDSGISGPVLAKAHVELGRALGEQIKERFSHDTTVVAILRGGIFMATGLYYALGCRFDVYDPKKDKFIRPKTKNVILVDSVINTGKTIEEMSGSDISIASCVINENAVEKFKDKLYTIRVSKNSYVGDNTKVQKGNRGPDTTMRLFNQI
mgnify:FL=1|nr:phosphoribosyltransferase [uncultured Lachnoanaerobaculum sp.]